MPEQYLSIYELFSLDMTTVVAIPHVVSEFLLCKVGKLRHSQDNVTYIAQKESRIPKGRVSSHRNDVDNCRQIVFNFAIFNTINYI